MGEDRGRRWPPMAMGLAHESPPREWRCEGVRLLGNIVMLVLEVGGMVVISVRCGFRVYVLWFGTGSCVWEERVCDESMEGRGRKIIYGRGRSGGKLTRCIV
jgi:hypothetical protein